MLESSMLYTGGLVRCAMAICIKVKNQTTAVVSSELSIYSTFSFLVIMTVAMAGEIADEHAFLDSVDGEISFFRSIMRARPIGMHRHFHILTIRNAIRKDTGRSVHIETIWEKLRKCYDLDALDAIVSRFIPHAPMLK